ncbi:MAG: cupin domain-containing protein [Halioglobus sp.]
MTIDGLALNQELFLRDYWQRKPLLIRNTAGDYTAPIDADTVAGLALEECVESRIIENASDAWSVHHGPFSEQDFARKHPWTLLVQAVDHYMPEVAKLRQWADFIPHWRVDDVMVSYASDGGSVGPHYDHYDVFLLQGEGERLWRLGQQCDDSTALLEHDQIRVLADFEQTQEYLLGPGDMLYVPPGLAHWGIAQGECTTFSIGFRAPTVNDLLSRFTDSALESTRPDAFFTDAGRATPRRPGEIELVDIERARKIAIATLHANNQSQWFGELVTEPRYPLDEILDEAQATAALDHAQTLHVNAAAKLAWQEQDNVIAVFANGLSSIQDKCVLAHLIELCDNRKLGGQELVQARAQREARQLLIELLSAGVLHSDDEYD